MHEVIPAGSCSYHHLVEKHICAHKSKTLWLLIPRPGWSVRQSGLYEGERKSRLSWNRSQQGLWRIFSIRVTISGKRHSNVFFSALSTTSRVSSASVLFETNLIVSKTQQLTTTGGGICISTHLAQRSQHAWSSSVLCRYCWSPVHTWTFCIGGKQRTCVWLLIKAAAVVCVRRGLPPG